MPPSQRHLVVKSTAGIATPPPINTAEQPALSARERLRLHVQRNLQAQEQKARQLAEQQAAVARSGIPILPVSQNSPGANGGARSNQQNAGLQSLYAPIQDTRLGLSDIAGHELHDVIPAPCILPEASAAVAAAVGFAPLSTGDLGADIGLETNTESPPEFGDTPPYEQDGEWSVAAGSIGTHSHPGPIGQVGDDEWVEALIDMEPAPKD
jgi:hypothetical protein